MPRPFPVRLGLFILKLIAFTPVPLARPIGAPATTLRWHLGAQAPVCGRSQLSPTGAFNTAASSATPAAWRYWPRPAAPVPPFLGIAFGTNCLFDSRVYRRRWPRRRWDPPRPFHSQGGSRDCELGMPRLPVWDDGQLARCGSPRRALPPFPLNSPNASGGNQFLRNFAHFSPFCVNANAPSNAGGAPLNARRKLFVNPI